MKTKQIEGKFARKYSFVFKTVTLDNKKRETLALHFGKATRKKDKENNDLFATFS